MLHRIRSVTSPLFSPTANRCAWNPVMTQTLITIALRLNLRCLGLAATPAASHAQRYLVNGHAATEKEEQLLVSYGFDRGAWRING